MPSPQDETQQTPAEKQDVGIDPEALAEIIFQLMRRELLLENERLGK